MNNTFLKFALIVFILLFVLAVIPWIGDAMKGKGSDAKSNENVSVNLAAFTENSVDHIAMKQKDKDEVALERQGSDWKIGADTADKDKVASIFQAFAQLKIREMVSKNEENFKKFGVTKEDGIRLALRDKSGKDQVFYIGIEGDVPREFFIRKDGIKNAYSVSGNLRDLLTKDASYWKETEEKTTENSPSSENKTPVSPAPSK